MYELLLGEEVYVKHPYTQEVYVGQVTAPPDFITVPADSVYVRLRKAPLPTGYGPIGSGFVYRKAECVRMWGNLERARQQQAVRETTAGARHDDADSQPDRAVWEQPS